MNQYHKRRVCRNATGLPSASLPLFAWAAQRHANDSASLPRAVHFVARRYSLTPSIARLVAEQAGFAMEF